MLYFIRRKNVGDIFIRARKYKGKKQFKIIKTNEVLGLPELVADQDSPALDHVRGAAVGAGGPAAVVHPDQVLAATQVHTNQA